LRFGVLDVDLLPEVFVADALSGPDPNMSFFQDIPQPP
jgi:hypothetical protein